MGVDSDEGGGTDVGVDDLVVEADTNALDDDVVRDGAERGKVVNGVGPLLNAHRRLPVHDGQDDEEIELENIGEGGGKKKGETGMATWRASACVSKTGTTATNNTRQNYPALDPFLSEF